MLCYGMSKKRYVSLHRRAAALGEFRQEIYVVLVGRQGNSGQPHGQRDGLGRGQHAAAIQQHRLGAAYIGMG